MRIFVLGPAGSGKSTLVKEFSKFLKDLGHDAKCVNLDPASEPVYRADVDIRDQVRAEEVMKRYNLGINGAMLKAINLMLKFSEELKLDSDFVLYDTPGQMEIFIYSESGPELVCRLKDAQTCGLFLIDSGMVRTPEKFVSAVLQNVVVMLRLGIPTLSVLTKSDLWDIDIKRLLSEVKSGRGILLEIMEKMAPLVEYTSMRYRTIKISSVKKLGFHELLSALREIFCACGDLS
jgi:GTPase SAR1 family protein